MIKIALVDDHILLRNALAVLISNFGDCKIILECSGGKELITAVSSGTIPDVVILDLNMPELNGYETAEWLNKNCISAKVLMLTMFDSELALIRLLHNGVKGFLKKDIHPSELKFAIHSVVNTGFYYSTHTTGKLFNLFKQSDGVSSVQNSFLSNQELMFLKLACSDLTYKEIAQRMSLNPRTIDTLRDHLFIKLDVKSRVGLAMIAIRHGIVTF